MRSKQHLKPNCAQAQAGQSKSPARQIYENRAKYWTLYVTFKHPSKKRGRTKSEKKPRREKTPPKKGTRCVPKNKARRAQNAQGGNSPWRRRSPSCPPSAPAATLPPLQVSSLTYYNRGDKAQGSQKPKAMAPRKKQHKKGDISCHKSRAKRGKTRKMKIQLGDENFPKKKTEVKNSQKRGQQSRPVKNKKMKKTRHGAPKTKNERFNFMRQNPNWP